MENIIDMEQIINIININNIGWVGTFFGLLSFALISFGKIKKESLIFSLFSSLAAFSFLVSSYLINNYQAVFSNVFFLTAGILAVFGVFLKIESIKEKTLYYSCFIGFIISTFYYLYYTDELWIYHSLGWVAVISLPMIFFLFTQNKITETKYYIFNMTTNLIFFIHLIYFNNIPLAILQVIAFIFAGIGIKRLYFTI